MNFKSSSKLFLSILIMLTLTWHYGFGADLAGSKDRRIHVFKIGEALGRSASACTKEDPREVVRQMEVLKSLLDAMEESSGRNSPEPNRELYKRFRGLHKSMPGYIKYMEKDASGPRDKYLKRIKSTEKNLRNKYDRISGDLMKYRSKKKKGMEQMVFDMTIPHDFQLGYLSGQGAMDGRSLSRGSHGKVLDDIIRVMKHVERDSNSAWFQADKYEFDFQCAKLAESLKDGLGNHVKVSMASKEIISGYEKWKRESNSKKIAREGEKKGYRDEKYSDSGDVLYGKRYVEPVWYVYDTPGAYKSFMKKYGETQKPKPDDYYVDRLIGLITDVKPIYEKLTGVLGQIRSREDAVRRWPDLMKLYKERAPYDLEIIIIEVITGGKTRTGQRLSEIKKKIRQKNNGQDQDKISKPYSREIHRIKGSWFTVKDEIDKMINYYRYDLKAIRKRGKPYHHGNMHPLYKEMMKKLYELIAKKKEVIKKLVPILRSIKGPADMDARASQVQELMLENKKLELEIVTIRQCFGTIIIRYKLDQKMYNDNREYYKLEWVLRQEENHVRGLPHVGLRWTRKVHKKNIGQERPYKKKMEDNYVQWKADCAYLIFGPEAITKHNGKVISPRKDYLDKYRDE